MFNQATISSPVEPRMLLSALRRLGTLNAIGTLFQRLAEWQDRVQSRHQLSEMDDRMLKDIGISRVDALYEANKPFWRE